MKGEAILEKVCASIDILVEAGKAHGGLFPSLLDLETHEMPVALPPAIEGQRMHDRAHPGCNLMHDHPTLKAMYGLSRALGRGDYAKAADRYLQRFATHCTDTATGLFPWGEHAFWDFEKDGIGDSHCFGDPEVMPNQHWDGTALHDHLRQAPVWLWEKLYAFNPDCVTGFAEGLDYHYKDGEPRRYMRHAYIEVKARHRPWPRSQDYPRHGGFYILDWACAYVKTGREDFLRQIDEMVDYAWPRRDEKGVLLQHIVPEDAHDYNSNGVAQTLSLAASLLEAAVLLEDREPELAQRMRERAGVYIGGFLGAPHDLENGVVVSTARRGTGEPLGNSPIWGSVYGLWPASYVALMCLCAYRLTEDERLRSWAEGVGRCYTKTPFPEGVAMPAMDPGLGIELLGDLYDLTGDASWLEGGLRLAEQVMGIYMDGDLVRGAAGIDWYESQMVPGDLMHGLARLALLDADRKNCPLEANYSGR